MWKEIFSNRIISATLISWFIAQSIKIIFNVVREKKFSFVWLLSTGGMPSAHAASVSCLSVSIGIKQGFSSSLFAFSVIFALIVMFDAQTWRRSIGVQARILNNIVDDLYSGRQIEEKKLRELIGHTPVEVFVGALLGVLTAIIFTL